MFFSYTFQLILMQVSAEIDHWRIMFGLPLLTIALQTALLLFVFSEETPKYLLLHDKEQ